MATLTIDLMHINDIDLNLLRLLAEPVRQALATLEQALGQAAGFEPGQARRTFRIHMSDIGEGRFLPELMVALRQQSPGVRVETLPQLHGNPQLIARSLGS